MLQGSNVIKQFSQNPTTYIPSQINSLMYSSKQLNSTHIQEMVNNVEQQGWGNPRVSR
ncbi:hypothetical protein ACB092_07G048200 [Castanea dentata]